jgi:hypothetical protein
LVAFWISGKVNFVLPGISLSEEFLCMGLYSPRIDRLLSKVLPLLEPCELNDCETGNLTELILPELLSTRTARKHPNDTRSKKIKKCLRVLLSEFNPIHLLINYVSITKMFNIIKALNYCKLEGHNPSATTGSEIPLEPKKKLTNDTLRYGFPRCITTLVKQFDQNGPGAMTKWRQMENKQMKKRRVQTHEEECRTRRIKVKLRSIPTAADMLRTEYKQR